MKTIKVFGICAALLWAALALSAQAPEWDWAIQSGGPGDESAYDIITDGQGNIYLTAIFTGTATFGSFTFTSQGGFDFILAKLDAAGNFLNVISTGGPGDDSCSTLLLDGAGNVYVIGVFNETASFGPYTLTSAGGRDIFVAKLGPAFNYLWAIRAGGPTWDNVTSLALDGTGNLLFSGTFEQTADFGPTTLVSNGESDIYVAKLGLAGNWLWTLQAGGPGWDYNFSLVPDSAGNLHLAGMFSDTASFGSITLTSVGGGDVYTAKMDPAGNFLWVVFGGGTDFDYAGDLILDSAGNIYLTGRIDSATASFGPFTLESYGIGDVFAGKLDPAGNWLWAVNAGGSSWEYGARIALDSAGYPLLVGYFESPSAAFGPFTLVNSGICNGYMARLDPGGNFLWAMGIGGSGYDGINGIWVDSQDNTLIWGAFNSPSLAFGSTTLINSGGYDLFLTKTAPPGADAPPRAPQNIQLVMDGDNALLSWDAVTQTTANTPVTPDYYLVFTSPDPYGSFSFHGASTGPQYSQLLAGYYFPHLFYRVAAFKFSGRGSFDLAARGLEPGLPEEEVWRRLRD